MPVDVRIHFKDGTVKSAENAEADEGITALTVHTAPGEKTVVPLVNVLFYDIEECS